MLDAVSSKVIGDYPIIQFGIVGLMAFVSYVIWVHKIMPKEHRPDVQQSDAPVLYQMKDLLNAIYRVLQEMREDNERHSDEIEKRDDKRLDALHGIREKLGVTRRR